MIQEKKEEEKKKPAIVARNKSKQTQAKTKTKAHADLTDFAGDLDDFFMGKTNQAPDFPASATSTNTAGNKAKK